MRLPANIRTQSISRPAVLFLAALLLAVLAVSLSRGGPAVAGDDYEPDAAVVQAVEGYSKELTNGYDHVLRWFRVLHTFGALADMTAAEAQEHAVTYWHVRWDPVVAELEAMESDAGHTPDAAVVADVREYAKETGSGYDHVLRWFRVLHTFGAIEDMTAAEAQENADTYSADRWDPVVEELRRLEDDGPSGQGGPSGSGEPSGGDGPSGQDDASGQQQSCTITLTGNFTGPHSPGDDPANPHSPYVLELSWTYSSSCSGGTFASTGRGPAPPSGTKVPGSPGA